MSDDFFKGLTPEEAYEIGLGVGKYDVQVEAMRAHEMGEIDLWIEYVTPKSWEDWESWREKYGEDFENRWKV